MNPRRFQNWSDAEIDVLRAMFHAGRTDEEMAKALTRTMSSVTSRRQALGLTRPSGFTQGYDGPYTVAPNDDRKHIELIAQATGGKTFHFYDRVPL